jgi:hypothetical protein
MIQQGVPVQLLKPGMISYFFGTVGAQPIAWILFQKFLEQILQFGGDGLDQGKLTFGS